jgi:hypothetical protein
MGFTVEEQILAVVVGILATFLANKMGADGSSSGASMKSNLKEITTIQTELANASADIVDALKEATLKGQALFAAGDKKGLATLAERAASLRGAFVESYSDTHDMDPSTIKLPLPDTDAAAVNLGSKDDLVKELSEEVTMKILTVERVTDMKILNPLPRDTKDPYYQYIYLTWTQQLGDVYVVVVNTGILGLVEYSKLSWNGLGKVYNWKVKKKTYDQLKKGECKILFTTESVSPLAATGIALKYGASIGVDPRTKGTTFDSWICFSYTGVESVKA